MISDGIHDGLDDSYNRSIYNVIINPKMEYSCSNNSSFSSFDMFPTILNSIGVYISDNKLGLGVSLFSCENTLVEDLGDNYLSVELSKNSKYYNNCLVFGNCD